MVKKFAPNVDNRRGWIEECVGLVVNSLTINKETAADNQVGGCFILIKFGFEFILQRGKGGIDHIKVRHRIHQFPVGAILSGIL